MTAKVIKLTVLVCCGLLAGCSAVDFFRPEGPPKNGQIYSIYRSTVLKQSTSSDVLAAFGTPKYAILSQSKSIVALAGEKKKGYKTWFNMVTFDESEPIAMRKYVFISDEKPRQLFVEPWEGVYFDCKIVLPKEVLAEPYANENARRIAILKQVGADIRKDTGEVGKDNKDMEICGIIIGQGIDTVLVMLKESPGAASRLSEPDGLELEHTSYDKEKLRMVVVDDVVTVRMRLGSFAKESKIKVNLDGTVEGD
jgi:hypothetical protein